MLEDFRCQPFVQCCVLTVWLDIYWRCNGKYLYTQYTCAVNVQCEQTSSLENLDSVTRSCFATPIKWFACTGTTLTTHYTHCRHYIYRHTADTYRHTAGQHLDQCFLLINTRMNVTLTNTVALTQESVTQQKIKTEISRGIFIVALTIRSPFENFVSNFYKRKRKTVNL